MRISFSNSGAVERHSFAISRPDMPEVRWKFPYPPIRGRRECRAPDAPDSRVCKGVCESAHALVRSHRTHPAPPAQLFTAYFVLSPATGLSCHRRPRKLPFANLTPASGRQDHTSSPSASAPFVYLRIPFHRRPPRIRDDRETPL